MIVDQALARRLEAVAAAFTLAWLEGAAARPGNPRHLAFLTLGDVVAPASIARPELDLFNRPLGLTPDQREHVPAIVSWYRHQGIWPWFELAPLDGLRELLDALAAEGAWPVGAVTVLAERVDVLRDRVTDRPEWPPPGVVVEVLGAGASDEARATFARTLLIGHGLPLEELDGAVADMAHWADVPGAHLVLARVEGAPAGAGALFERDGVGYLANAAVVPEHRGRGVHGQLVLRRLGLAAEHRCEVVSSLVESFGGPSHRTLQRAGLRNAYGKIVLHLGG